MYYSTIKSQLKILILLISIVFLVSCNKNQDSPFPEADQQNIDGNALAEAFNNAAAIENLQGLAISRNGIIVAEEYYNNASNEPDTNLHVMSVTKSISSILIGIAIDNGFIQSVNQTLSDFLGAEVDTVNAELGQVNIHQLLTMSMGQDWHELGGNSEFMDFVRAPDQLTYVIEKPLINTPGTIFNYSDGTAHLISFVLSKATGMETYDFAKQYLFDPMGFGDRYWYVDNRGYAYGGVGLCLGIHDMINIGNLYLNNGEFNGQQIVSSEWMSTSTSFHISTQNIISFLPDYGYFWWLGNAYGHDFICANGYAGQFIFIVKELNLVVCSRTNYLGTTEAEDGQNWYNVLNLIINQILPTVND